jgi:hypothetical protein
MVTADFVAKVVGDPAAAAAYSRRNALQWCLCAESPETPETFTRNRARSIGGRHRRIARCTFAAQGIDFRRNRSVIRIIELEVEAIVVGITPRHDRAS